MFWGYHYHSVYICLYYICFLYNCSNMFFYTSYYHYMQLMMAGLQIESCLDYFYINLLLGSTL